MSTNVTQNKQNPVAAFSSFMERLKPQLALALPKHLTADRMSRLALTAFSTNPSLQDCDQMSIAAAVMTAGQLGLEPHVNGAGFLIPYGKTCTFVAGWKGLVDLVSRSGRGTVFTGVIYKDQQYSFTDGARRDLIIHNETELDGEEDLTHAYAIGWVKDSSMPIIELWTIERIKKHRDKYNKVGKKHYSFRDFEMYARKIPLLQVLKYMPCSVEVANAMAVTNASESGRAATIENGIVIDTGDQFGNNAEEVQNVYFTDEKFAEKLTEWRTQFDNGVKAEKLISMVETKGVKFTDEQKTELKNYAQKPKESEIDNSFVKDMEKTESESK